MSENKKRSRSAVIQTEILNSTDKLRKNGMHVGPTKSTAQVRRNSQKKSAPVENKKEKEKEKKS